MFTNSSKILTLILTIVTDITWLKRIIFSRKMMF